MMYSVLSQCSVDSVASGLRVKVQKLRTEQLLDLDNSRQEPEAITVWPFLPSPIQQYVIISHIQQGCCMGLISFWYFQLAMVKPNLG